ncbi:MAG TPA: F0F1 ATP synthase subunit B [Gammaproteobacteria bacterium]|nr:F0F1 ATP synthase subunit B [Gammaproteobacteria bacterium]
MNLNATLFGQMITFAFFVWFTKALVWPLLEKALRERRERIAEGLAAAERGHNSLALAQKKAAQELRDTRKKALQIMEDARKQAALLVENAKIKARVEGEKILQQADVEVKQLVTEVKESLRVQVADIALLGAEKIISQKVDAKMHRALLDELVQQL